MPGMQQKKKKTVSDDESDVFVFIKSSHFITWNIFIYFMKLNKKENNNNNWEEQVNKLGKLVTTQISFVVIIIMWRFNSTWLL